MKKLQFPLAYKVLIAFALLLSPILIAFFYTYSQDKKMLEQDIMKNLAIIADESEAQVYQFIEMEKRRAQDFSSDGFIRERLQTAMSGDKSAISGINRHLLKNKLPLDKNIERILVLSMKGRVVASTDGSLIGQDIPKEIFFTTEKTGWNIIEKDDIAGNFHALFVSNLIADRDTGKPMGILVNFVSVSAFNSVLSGSFARELGALSSGTKGRYNTLEIYLVDQNRVMLTESLFVKDAIFKQRVDTSPVRKCINENKEHSGFYKNYMGIKVAGASMCLPKLKWTLVAEIESYEILASIRFVQRNAIIAAAVVVVVLLVSVVFFFKHVILPLRRMSASAKVMANGDYYIKLPFKTKDEIGGLSDSLNLLSRQIQERTNLLLESQASLQAIIENSPAVIYVKGAEGKYIMANRKWETLFGLSNEQIAGKTVYDIFPKETADILMKNDMGVLKSGVPDQFEEIIPQSDGSHHYISVKFPLLDKSGTVYAVCGISTDITEQKNAADERFEARQKYEELVNNLPVGVYRRKINGELVEVNPAALSVLDLDSKDDFANHSVAEFYKDKQKFKETSDKLARYGFVKNEELEFVSAKGRSFWCSFSGAIKKEKDGNSYFNGIFFDVTDKKKAEEARLEAQQRYKELLNNLNIGIYRRAADGTIVEANRALMAMFEAGSKEEIINHNAFNFARDKDKLKEVTGRLLKYGYIKDEELEVLTLKGRPLTCSFSAMVKKDKQGNLLYVDGMIEDVSEKKALEEQLRHSQKMEAIGQLAGGIAHDFNNILTAIIGYGNLLLKKKHDDDITKDYVGEMLGAANRAATLTKDLLSFSRKHVIATQPFDLNELVKKSRNILTRVIGEHIEFKADIADKKLVVKMDAAHIEQVLLNLATNARDAMPRGGKLSISTGIVTIDNDFIIAHGYGKAGNYAVLTFADTGAGMTREVQSRLFEPFFTTKEVGKGTGLGLSTAYGVVKQHNGFINVYSEPERGTVFKIYLPLTGDAAQVDKKTAKDIIIVSKGNMETILVAEDAPEARKITRTVLEEYNYRIIEAENGEDAVNKFVANKEEIRLVILDVIMPKKGGMEAYNDIRKISPGIKCLFVSGYTGDMIKAMDIDKEGLKLLSKPVSPNELLTRIREMLGR